MIEGTRTKINSDGHEMFEGQATQEQLKRVEIFSVLTDRPHRSNDIDDDIERNTKRKENENRDPTNQDSIKQTSDSSTSTYTVDSSTSTDTVDSSTSTDTVDSSTSTYTVDSSTSTDTVDSYPHDNTADSEIDQVNFLKLKKLKRDQNPKVLSTNPNLLSDEISANDVSLLLLNLIRMVQGSGGYKAWDALTRQEPVMIAITGPNWNFYKFHQLRSYGVTGLRKS